jgi:hypothetical protein
MRKKDGTEKGVRRTKIFIHTTHLHPIKTSKRKSSRIFAPADTCTKRSGNMRKKAELFLLPVQFFFIQVGFRGIFIIIFVVF